MRNFSPIALALALVALGAFACDVERSEKVSSPLVDLSKMPVYNLEQTPEVRMRAAEVYVPESEITVRAEEVTMPDLVITVPYDTTER